MSTCASPVQRPVQRRPYRRHRPERTTLHAIVREHLRAFLRHAEEHYARPLPKYVVRAFERYLRCGVPEHGFLRVRCDDCGHDRVVAFSCKERGTCPSCAGRTMTNTAAHVVDRVLPRVPIRQWVLSLPFDLRVLAARTPTLVSAIDRILFREIERWMQRSAGPRSGRAGSVTFVQRFGGSLNLHVHFHVLFLEGLFTREGAAPPRFHPALSPTRADLLEVLGRVRAAALRWIERRGLARQPTDLAESDPAALDGCTYAALQPGLFDRIPTDAAPAAGTGDDTDDEVDEPSGFGRSSVALHGFNLHAAVHVGADDDLTRERLVRYCARPPFALERLTVLGDGRIAYRIKQPRRGATHRILTPLELLARIAALIPPPRHPFLRYHGVLAPSSKWRAAIVPRDPDEQSCTQRARSAHASGAGDHRRACASSSSTTPRSVTPPPSNAPGVPVPPAQRLSLAHRSSDASARVAPHATGRDVRGARAPFAVLSDAHRARVGTELLATSPRLDWHQLLRRTFAADVLECPRCKGRCRVIAAVQDPTEAARFLAAIGEPSRPIPSGAAADDDDLDHPALDDDDLDHPAADELDADDSQLPPPSSRPGAVSLPDD